jgi:hypothetical protein
MNKLLNILFIFLLLENSSHAQIGKPLVDVVNFFGDPVKEHNKTQYPTKIFINEGIQIQLTLKNGIVDAAVYSVAYLASDYKRKPINAVQIEKIYAWNNISKDDLVNIEISEYPQLNGLLQKTKDSKLIITHNKNENLLTICESKSLLEYMNSQK